MQDKLEMTRLEKPNAASSPNSRIGATPNGSSSTSTDRKRSRPCSADLQFNSFPDRLLEILQPYNSPVQRRDAIDVELQPLDIFIKIDRRRRRDSRRRIVTRKRSVGVHFNEHLLFGQINHDESFVVRAILEVV